MARPLVIQPKMSVGASDDAMEREADAVAARVTAVLASGEADARNSAHVPSLGPAPSRIAPAAVSRLAIDLPVADGPGRGSDEGIQPVTASASRLRRAMIGGLGGDSVVNPGWGAGVGFRRGGSNVAARPINRSAELVGSTIGASGGDVDGSTERKINAARSGGRPMAPTLRRSMEQAIGADFSRVRLHVSADSDDLNRKIQARAFTTGSDIFVRRSEYRPDTRSGQALLAHELTHTVQQGASPVGPQESSS